MVYIQAERVTSKKKKKAYTKTFEFTAAVRWYHYYRRFWIPQPAQHLNCSHEPDNPFDQFTIKICEIGCETPIGHLPREISRATKFFIDRGAVVNAILTGHNTLCNKGFNPWNLFKLIADGALQGTYSKKLH